MGKSLWFYQQSEPTVTPDPDEPYAFFASVESSSPGTVTSVDMSAPNGVSETMYPDNGYLDFEATFSTSAELNALLPDDPNNPYTMTIHAVNDGSVGVSLFLRGGPYPVAPRLTNFNAAQQMDPDQPFVLQWNQFDGGTTDDLVMVYISWGDQDVFETGLPGEPNALDGTQTSVQIPADALKPGRTYELELEFIRMADLNTTDYPGATGFAVYLSGTTALVRTTGTPEQPQDASLSLMYWHEAVILDDPLTGPVTPWAPNPIPTYFQVQMEAIDSLGLPEDVQFTVPFASGPESMSSQGYWEDYDNPSRRFYYSESRLGPPWPAAGDYQVSYLDKTLPFTRTAPDPGAATIHVVPEITLDASGEFQTLDWSYHDAGGNPVPLPDNYTQLSLMFNTLQANLDPLDNLPLNSTSVTLAAPIAWADVFSLSFVLRDDQGNQLISTADRSEYLQVFPSFEIPGGTADEAYEMQLMVAGGRPPYQWSPAEGSPLPAWLSISPSGLLSGTPPSPGDYYLSLQIEDATPQTQWISYALSVQANANQLDYQTWLAQYFTPGELSQPAIVDPTADSDLDQQPNLLEFAYATIPNSPDPLQNALTVRMEGDRLVVKHPENSMAFGVAVEVQILGSLTNPQVWTRLQDIIPPGELTSDLLPPDHPERRWRELSFPRSQAPLNGFIRLEIVQQ